MKHCSVCHKEIAEENPAVLTLTAFANPKYVCKECEEDLDKATLSKDPEEISAAIQNIGDKMKNADNDDKLILNIVTEILNAAAERGELIKDGVYDFSNDEAQEKEGEDSVPEELLETEEDRELDRKEEESKKKFDKILNWVMLAVVLGIVGFAAFKIITMLI